MNKEMQQRLTDLVQHTQNSPQDRTLMFGVIGELAALHDRVTALENKPQTVTTKKVTKKTVPKGVE